MADGDFIPTDGDTQTDQGTWLKHLSLGTKNYQHEPHSFDDIPMIHRTRTQMLQLAPGHKWCKTCGDVRRNSYFDVLAYDEKGTPLKYADECRQCMNMRDPKLRSVKFCSGCKTEKKRAEFGEDTRNVDGLRSICNDCEKLDKADYRRRKAAEEGRGMRPYLSRASA